MESIHEERYALRESPSPRFEIELVNDLSCQAQVARRAKNRLCTLMRENPSIGCHLARVSQNCSRASFSSLEIPKHFCEPSAVDTLQRIFDILVRSRLSEPYVFSDVRGVHASQPYAESMFLDEGDMQTELFPCVKQDADRKVRSPDTLSIAANPSAKLSKRIPDVLVYQPPDLGQQVTGLRLRLPRLESADVSESNEGVNLNAARCKETWNLTEILKLLGGRIDAEKIQPISFRKSMQYLECRQSSIAFDDNK